MLIYAAMEILKVLYHPLLFLLFGFVVLHMIRSTAFFVRIRISAIFVVFFFTIQWVFYNFRISEQFPRFVLLLDELSLHQWLNAFLVFFGTLLTIRVMDWLLFGRRQAEKQISPVPVLLRDLMTIIILVIVILFVMKTQFGIRPSALITTSAVLSAIIGLALQDVLGNILAGIALHIEKPFRVQDWIRMGDLEGRVLSVNWRATRIITHDAETIVIPNGKLSKESIVNYSKPTKNHAVKTRIGLPYSARPNQVKDIIVGVILATDGVVRNPRPQLRLKEYADFSILYEIRFWINDRQKYPDIMDAVMTGIWYALKRKGIVIPFPIRDVFFHDAEKIRAAQEHEFRETEFRLVRSMDLFKPLSDDRIHELCSRLAHGNFARGETIVQEGQKGNSLFLLMSGSVEVFSKDDEDGSLDRIGRLEAGDFFGELSLLTGEPRSATIIAENDVEVLIIEKGDLVPLLESQPDIVGKLSLALAQRQFLREEAREKSRESRKKEEEARSHDLRAKICRFFGVSG